MPGPDEAVARGREDALAAGRGRHSPGRPGVGLVPDPRRHGHGRDGEDVQGDDGCRDKAGHTASS